MSPIDGWEPVDDLCSIKIEGMEGEASIICGGGLSGLFLTCSSSDGVILSIDEVARVVEEFLGRYTAEKNGKQENVMRGPHINRVCSGCGPAKEPNEERRKNKRSRPADDELSDTIPFVPLWVVALGSSTPNFGADCPTS